MVIVTIVVFFLSAFLFWQRLKGLGFKVIQIFDLLFLMALASTLGGKLFSPDFFRIFLSKFKWSTVYFLSTPIFFPAALFFGLVTFFWFVNRKKWSVFTVSDQASSIIAGAYLLANLPLTIDNLQLKGQISFPNYAELTLCAGGILLLILNLTIFKRQFFKGFGLFITLIIISALNVLSILNSQFSIVNRSLALTFLGGVVILSLFGIIRRTRLNIMNSPLDLMTALKHRLLGKKEQITEEQLKLPGDDPFLRPGRTEDNSPEEEVDELAGKIKVDAESEFLKESEKRVDEALDKVKKGTYGVCSNCHKTIEPARLQADPTAILCIDCAKRSEKPL